jgi:biotin carboxylase
MKKIIILGGNQETAYLVKYAKDLGYITIVIDPNPNAPAKKVSSYSYDFDGFDILSIANVFHNENADGILVGVADILVKPYYELCEKLNTHCYANPKSTFYLTNKANFRQLCELNDIEVIPYFTLETLNKVTERDFPLLLKPVDNGAGVGIDIAYSMENIYDKVQNCLTYSKSKNLIIEKFMNANDLFAYYTIADSKIYLSCLADRITRKITKETSPVCILARYTSKFLNHYINVMNDKVINMLQSLNINYGILNIQFFKDGDTFYPYDPGFRFQGEGMHYHLFNQFGIDQRKMLLNFSHSGTFGDNSTLKVIDPFFNNSFNFTIWILVKEGEIGTISGLDEINLLDGVFNLISRFEIGDKITQDMIGTERQVFARIYVSLKEIQSFEFLVLNIKNKLRVLDLKGNDLVIDFYQDIINEVKNNE